MTPGRARSGRTPTKASSSPSNMRAVQWSAPHSDILADRDTADIHTDILAKLPKPVESTVNSALFRELRTAGGSRSRALPFHQFGLCAENPSRARRERTVLYRTLDETQRRSVRSGLPQA